MRTLLCILLVSLLFLSFSECDDHHGGHDEERRMPRIQSVSTIIVTLVAVSMSVIGAGVLMLMIYVFIDIHYMSQNTIALSTSTTSDELTGSTSSLIIGSDLNVKNGGLVTTYR